MIPAAWPYVVSLAVLALLSFVFLHPGWALLPVLAGLAIGLFFRDPERAIPSGEGLVVAPADGRVVEVVPAGPADRGRIAIFLSLFNVHVNRSPVAGRVRDVTYRPGSFRPAWEKEAAARNECNTLALEAPSGSFDVSQIAGLVARRITCYKKAGDAVERGERIGYIAFGSRTELTLPPGAEILVRRGESVRGGETVVARLAGSGGERT